MRPRVREDSSSPPQSPLMLPPEAQPQSDLATASMTARRTGVGGGLSSLVVRPSENKGFEENGVGNGDAHVSGGLDKPSSPFRRRRSLSPGFRRRSSPPRFRRRESPSEFRRRDPPGFHPSRGFKDNADSLSPPPLRSRLDDGRHDPDYHYQPRPSFGRGIRGGRGSGRFRDVSPHYGPSRGRSSGRGHTLPRQLSPVEGDYVHINDPNLSPREGDWICQKPSCGNLNFARRTHCSNCDLYRFGPDVCEFSRSPRRDYINSPSRFHSPPRLSGLPRVNRPLQREASFQSAPRGWTMDDSRDFRYGSPDLRRGRRLPDDNGREKPDYDNEHEHMNRHRFDWSSRHGEWDPRSGERDDFISTRQKMGHRSPSPSHARWFRYERERSRNRSPVTGVGSFTYAGRYEGDCPKRYSGSFTGRGQHSSSDTGRGRGRGHIYRHNNDIIGRPADHRRTNRENLY